MHYPIGGNGESDQFPVIAEQNRFTEPLAVSRTDFPLQIQSSV